MWINKIIACLILFIILITIKACTRGEELVWNENGDHSWAELHTGFFENTGFEIVKSGESNIHFRNDLDEKSIAENQHLLNGSGVALGDINGDGLVDIYFAGIRGSNKLYKNLGGFRFEDITEKAGVALEGVQSTGVVFADMNGNGHMDLLVASLGDGIYLIMNDGEGNFTLQEKSGLDSSSGNHTMALADINGSGYLDLYVVNNKLKSAKDIFDIRELFVENIVVEQEDSFKLVPPFDKHFTLFVKDGKPDPRQHAEPDELFINLGNGEFKKVTDTGKYFIDESGNNSGLKPDWGLSAKFQDLNGNGLPDLYVTNDFWTPDRVWMNRGDGTFKAIDKHAIRSFSYSAMDVDFSDINRDGFTDIFVTEMLSPNHELRMTQSVNRLPYRIRIGNTDERALQNHNSLFVNRGDHTYQQISYYSGVSMSGWSWAAKFLDIDLDGYEDLLITTGYSRDGRDLDVHKELNQKLSRNELDSKKMILEYPRRALQNVIFKNNGDTESSRDGQVLTFSEKSSEWGFSEPDVSHGMAVGDLNNDGVQDVVMNRMNEEAAIYRNITNAPRIAIQLEGELPNSNGIGAKVELEGGPVKQTKEVAAGGEYLSGSVPLVVFAADKENSDHVITVRWRNGSVSIIKNVKANRIYKIFESKSSKPAERIGKNVSKASLFRDISDRLRHKHHENRFYDFNIQPLLPLRLSQFGPGVSWIDINRNGFDDLLISSGKNGVMSIHENLGDGYFKSIDLPELKTPAPGDQTSIVGWGEKNYTRLVVGNANYEQDKLDVPSAFHYMILPDYNIVKEELPAANSTTGMIAAADYNSNGYVDIFVGGRFVPGNYPKNADSRVYSNDGNTFRLDESNSKVFENIGLVTGALFADFNNNGKQDLLVSTEWGTLKLFTNKNGLFTDISDEVGLDNHSGWWNGIAVGDFNNNGFPDIIATNMGLNSTYGNVYKTPLKLFYDDFNLNGRLNIIESYNDNGSFMPTRKLHDLFQELPELNNHIDSHKEFASMSVENLLRSGLKESEFSDIPSKELNRLEHTIFLNRDGHFTANALPAEAQFTSAQSIGVADFDNDGSEDIFLSQNFFAFPENTPRQDAGRGLILLGDGTGQFNVLRGSESGIKVYGEQRGTALGDFNQNGKTDIIVSQNGSETKFYLNQVEKEGIYVNLEGPEENKDAIGSSIRLVFNDGKLGPRRYIQAGSGYLSQNSSAQVLGIPDNQEPLYIQIDWYNGKEQTIDTQPGKMIYRISIFTNR